MKGSSKKAAASVIALGVALAAVTGYAAQAKADTQAGRSSTDMAHMMRQSQGQAMPMMQSGQGGMMGQGQAGSGMMGQGHMGQGQMGPGMMGQGQMGSGMMGSMPMMMQMHRSMMDHMMGGADGHKGGAKEHGIRVQKLQHLSEDDVRHYFEHWLEGRGNKRLKVGDVKTMEDDMISVDITTIDDSLVRRYRVDRHSGRAMPVE